MVTSVESIIKWKRPLSFFKEVFSTNYYYYYYYVFYRYLWYGSPHFARLRFFLVNTIFALVVQINTNYLLVCLLYIWLITVTATTAKTMLINEINIFIKLPEAGNKNIYKLTIEQHSITGFALICTYSHAFFDLRVTEFLIPNTKFCGIISIVINNSIVITQIIKLIWLP